MRMVGLVVMPVMVIVPMSVFEEPSAGEVTSSPTIAIMMAGS